METKNSTKELHKSQNSTSSLPSNLQKPVDEIELGEIEDLPRRSRASRTSSATTVGLSNAPTAGTSSVSDGSDATEGLALDLFEDLEGEHEPVSEFESSVEEAPFQDLENLIKSGELDSDWQIELALKNPQLCAQLREVAEQNKLDVDEVGDYLNIYYRDYKRTMRPQTNRSLAEIVSIYNCLGMAAPVSLGELFARRPEEIDSLYHQTSKFVDELPKPEEFQQQNLAQLLVAFARSYSSKVFSDEFIDTITAFAKRALQDDAETDDLVLSLKIVAASQDSACLPAYMSYHHELAKDPARASILQHYFELHGLDDQRIQGFRDNIFPMLTAGDAEVAILKNPHGAWAVKYGAFSLADFVCHCLVSQATPSNLAELLWAYHTLPSGDLSKFQQNRYDAEHLQDVLFPDYGFIYDSLPDAHEFLTLMVAYYDASENGPSLVATTALQKALAARLSSNGARYYGGFDKMIFDLDNYDRPVRLSDKNGAEYRTPAIEVLRRLVKNTNQSSLAKPQTGDIELDDLIESVEIWTDPEDGRVKVDWQQAGDLVKCLNDILLEKQNNIGLRPTFIAAVSFTKRLVTQALTSLTAEDRLEMPFDQTFKEILKFRELTLAPDKFDAVGFEKFWKKFSDVNLEDVFSMRESYQLLAQRLLSQLNKLSARYLQNPHTAHLVQEVWHDGLVYEICQLAGCHAILEE